jgi:hypothetical protein
MKQVRLIGNDAIKRQDERVLQLATRQYSLLLAAQIECRLKQLSYEPPVTARQRAQITGNQLPQVDQWLAAIDVGFRKHYGVRGANFSRLPFTARSRRTALREIVDVELRPVIELRNSLAHGQWAYVLNNAGTGLNQPMMRTLNTETQLSLAQKENLLMAMCRLIVSLVVSGSTFERDFDREYGAIDDARERLQTQDWEAHKQRLRERFARGQKQRAAK